MTLDSVSENPRYSLLDQQIFAARGEDLEIVIDGIERLQMISDTIMPEAACTSTQVHLQVSPDDFAGYWNAAQAIAGIQVAVGANSPYLFGRELVAESRIPLFEQSTDTRSDELKTQGVRPRVWFGERWITSIFDLFEENSRYFPALLPISTDEDPVEVLDAGGVPKLDELRLHNGTVYRWNRPVYDVSDGTPHLRVENRVLPAGPDRGRHHGQRRVLRRAGAGPGRRGPADLDPDVVPGRERELRRRHPATASTPRSTGRGSVRSRSPSWWCASCCRWRPTDCGAGGSTRPRAVGCSTSSSGAVCVRPTVRHGRLRRCRAASRPVSPGGRPCTGCSATYLERMHSNEPVHLWEVVPHERRPGQRTSAAPDGRSVIVVGYSAKPEGRAALERAVAEATTAATPG